MAGPTRPRQLLVAAWLCVLCTETHSSQLVGPSDTSAAITCSVSADGRYTTFDGLGFRFTGPCTYILAKVCDGAGKLADFTVEVRNDVAENASSSPIQQVTVDMQAVRVTFLRGHRHRAMVNGIWTSLPLTLDGDAVSISTRGSATVLQTHFNLSVSYAASGAVQVTAPAPYASELCGLCSNSVRLPSDGSAWALGWSRRSVYWPCEERPLPVACPEAEGAVYRSRALCGLLLARPGPFSHCAAALGVAGVFRSCVSEMCATRGDPHTFCRVLQDFASTCNQAGVPVTGWRNSTYCSPDCGAHGHLSICSGNCPAVCSGADAPEDCGNCEERCECDEGYLLSGGRCVPAEDCGCWADGQHYEKGQTFMEADCGAQCICVGHSNIQCSETSCLDGEVCGVKDGVVGCFPSSPVTCSTYGDPHYITFDGKAYSFRGTCNYTMVTTCGGGKVPFTLTARNERHLGSASSTLNSVALAVDGLHLLIRKNKLVYVNAGEVSLPYSHSTSINVSRKDPYVQVDTNFGLRVLFDGNERVFVQVDERHKGRICGLCGTYSGSQFDDFLTPNGTIVPYPHDFASSWNTQDKDWTCSDGPPDDPLCPPELDREAYEECSKLFGDTFKACHWFVPPQIFMSSCMRDHCSTAGDRTRLCASLQSYVAACEVAEVFLGDWWQETVCANISTVAPTPSPTTSSPPTASPTAGCPWSCDFDQGECGWEQLIQDSFNWTRWSGPTPSEYTGPTSDHTTGRGFYIYTEGDGVYRGDSARMMSPVCHSSGPQCISFWYHMYGALGIALNIYQLEINHATKIWSRANNHGDQWHHAQIQINSGGPFQVIVEGIRGVDARSDVGLDDVTVTRGLCPKPQPPSPFTTSGGHYLYIEGDSATHGDTARLLSDECSVLQPQCLQFWYHMYGSSWTMGLTVYLLHGNVAREIWRRREDQGNTWHRALVDFTPQHNFKILFEGRRGQNAESDVAVDDVSLYRGHCADLINDVTHTPNNDWLPETTPVKGQTTVAPVWNTVEPAQTAAPKPVNTTRSSVCTVACDFDNDLCSWTQLVTDVFDWTRQSGSTPTAMTGPSSDHTTGSGHYLYIEGDSATHGDTARLLSDECSVLQPQCLQFWYHMYGSSWTMGLTVYLLHGNVAREIWRKREDQGNTWHRALVDFTPQHNFKILFEGRRGQNAESDVAVDDVSLYRGHCADLIHDVTHTPNNDWLPETTPVKGQTTVAPVWNTVEPAQTAAPKPVNTTRSSVCTVACDFDNDLCSWTQLVTDVFDWTRQSGSTPTAMTGPSSDHTTGSGHYLYIEGDSATHGDTARLLSDECSVLQPQCLQFWYHMYGSSWTMGLTVYLLHGNVAREIWRRREDQGNTWHRALVDFTPQHNFKILFEGRRGQNAESDVAVDDVSLYRGHCAVACDFDNDLCSWTQLVTDVFDWTRQSGSTPTAMTGPSSDHTTGSGHYLYIEGDSATHGDTARLLSDECSVLQPQCLQFWYHMYGSSWTMGLTVYLLHGNVAREIWRRREDQGNTWHRALVDFTPQHNFKPTCEHLQGAPDCEVADLCVPGCVCEDGFILHHHECVPIHECGCRDEFGDDHYFGETWYSAHCTRECECKEKNGEGQMLCRVHACDSDQVCLADTLGNYRCRTTGFSKCSIKDDPEYRTFDDLKHRFKGKHSYVLILTSDLPKNTPEVYVVGINEKTQNQEDMEEDRDDKDAISRGRRDNDDDDDDDDEDDDNSKEDGEGRFHALRIEVYNHTVELQGHRRVLVDGVRVSMPVIPATGLNILEHSSRVYLKTDFGFSVEFRGMGKAEITLPHMYKRKVAGLCGNFDGQRKNDLMKPDAVRAKDVKEFGDSWRV
ncbi:uncharacterized protein wu:fb63a08 [Electrophorus electricus]|uniref:uncharacterized protein wu:fb63a08 n=1 Tax=Electrophorus electricus TaxID=8005 RepID=UPI0015CFBE8F|nr:uncharacterized protein wu:fb63a08 [Electrophorus electricus]